MTDASDAEWTTIENVLVKTREALADDDSPEATALKEQILEAEQIVSSKLDQNKSMGDSVSGPTGGAFPPSMNDGPPAADAQTADSTISMDDFKALGMHLQEAMAIIEKVMPAKGAALEEMMM